MNSLPCEERVISSPGFLGEKLTNSRDQIVRDLHGGVTGVFVGGLVLSHRLLFTLVFIMGDYPITTGQKTGQKQRFESQPGRVLNKLDRGRSLKSSEPTNQGSLVLVSW